MHPFFKLLSGLVASISLVGLFFSQPSVADLLYCSPQNTGSDHDSQFHIWQSNGWCHDRCVDDYAFAIVQDQLCWCSDYVPAKQQDIGDCSENCPGFPSEKCGKKGSLYGYIALGKQPSGTKGTPSSTVSLTSVPSSTSLDSSSSSSSGSTTTKKDSSSSSQTTLATTSSSSQTTTKQPMPITEVKTMTVSGVIVTQTVAAGVSPTAPAMSQTEKKKSNVGAIAGGVVGGVAGLALIGGLVFLLLRRRQQKKLADDPDNSGIHRNTSTMSKSGLLNRTEKGVPPLVTTMNRHSRHLDADSISPISGSDRRNSRPFIFDQRLNPSAIMDLDNASRSSLVTMDDTRDYTRTLNVRNPDPDTEADAETRPPSHSHPQAK